MHGEQTSQLQPGIKVIHVDKKFGKVSVLKDITMEVKANEIFGLLGPSGSGKTTLVKLIAGMAEPSNGEVYVSGVRMPNLNMLNNIGYMAQSDALYSELTALENLAFFAALVGLNGAVRKQRIEEVTQLVNLANFLKRPIATYSGGMKRRLSLAIALLHRPEILILDEPTVGIDPVLRKSIWDELRNLSQSGTTILLTTHVMDEAEKCTRLGMIRDGRLIAVGAPDELKQSAGSQSLEDAFLVYGGVRK